MGTTSSFSSMRCPLVCDESRQTVDRTGAPRAYGNRCGIPASEPSQDRDLQPRWRSVHRHRRARHVSRPASAATPGNLASLVWSRRSPWWQCRRDRRPARARLHCTRPVGGSRGCDPGLTMLPTLPSLLLLWRMRSRPTSSLGTRREREGRAPARGSQRCRRSTPRPPAGALALTTS